MEYFSFRYSRTVGQGERSLSGCTGGIPTSPDSIPEKTSLRAKRPISTGMKEKPSYKRTTSNVKRLTPLRGSSPMVFRSSPRSTAMKDSSQRPPPKDAIVERPRIARAKYTAGQNFSAIRAKGAEKSTRMMIPINPPATEATRETPSAVPASPFRVRG